MSQSSRVFDEIICHQDEPFIDEITSLNDLYFGNHTEFVPLSSSEDEEEDSETTDISVRNYTDSTYNSDYQHEFEYRTVDLDEVKFVCVFKTKTCGCSTLYGSPCSTKIEFDHMLEYRHQCQEMSSEELDLTVKVQLAANRKSSTYWPQSTGKKQKQKRDKEYHKSTILLVSKYVEILFLFCHGIEKFKLNSLAASLDKDCLKPRIHGNTGKTPKHAISLTDVQRISQFLNEYTFKNGLPLPGRQPNYSTRGDKVLFLLPSDKTKSDIWELYNQAYAATMLNYRYV